MIRYLSDEWLERADQAVGQSAELQQASEGQNVTIAYEVSGTPSGKVNYGIIVRDGKTSIAAGPHPDAPTSFVLDYATAVEIARGELSAQSAFMQGRLKLAGDVTVLVHQYRLIDGLADCLADLRAETEF